MVVPLRKKMLMLLSVCSLGNRLEAQNAEPVSALPPIVVTATNSPTQQAQAIPGATSTFSGRSLDLSGISSPADLGRIVPGLSESHAGSRSYSDTYVIRGMGNTEFLSDSAIAFYIDDVPQGNTLGYSTELLQIDQLQVLRGPQGTRFGENSEAGVINITTRQPSNAFEANGKTSYSTFDTRSFEGSVMGPIVKDTLYLGIAGKYEQSDGYINNTLLSSLPDKQHGIIGRATLRWTPVQDWEITLTAGVDKYDDGLGLVSLNSNPRETMSDLDGQFDELINNQALRIRGQVDNLAITSVTSRRQFEIDPFKADLDFSPVPGNFGIDNYSDVRWTEELRLQPALPSDSWDWHGGFFFSTEKIQVDRPTDFLIPPLGSPEFNNVDSLQHNNNYAVFGDSTYHATEQFDVTLGVRLEYSTRDMQRARTSSLGAPPPSASEANFFNGAPKLTLGYHLNESLLFYGSTGLGFKPGGLSPIIDPPATPKFVSEKVWANEVGIKSSWLDNRITANAALFYNGISDYQVEQFAPASLDTTIANAPHARTMGGEFELSTKPTDGLELSGFGGYTDARINRFTDPFTGAVVHDVRPPFVADFNAGTALQYRHKSGVIGRIQYSIVGNTTYDVENNSTFKQSAYGLLGGRIGYESDHFGIFLFGENLTDKAYYTKKIPPLNAGAPGRPLSLSVSLNVYY